MRRNDLRASLYHRFYFLVPLVSNRATQRLWRALVCFTVAFVLGLAWLYHRRRAALVEQGMRDGAVGLSTGLIYVPGSFAETAEIIELAKVAATMVDAVLTGSEPQINDTKTYDNGKKVVPSYLLKPVTVDITNWKQILIDSGYYKESQIH